MKSFRKITLIVFSLLAIPAAAGYGQQIIWEKQFGWFGFDDLTAVCEADSGNYFGLGGTRRFGLNQSGLGTFRGATLIKFDQNGDTLFVKNLNLLCQTWGTPYIGKFWNNQFVAIINVELPTSSSSSGTKRFPAILLLNQNGDILNSKYFPQYNWCIVNGVSSTPDNGLLLSGYHFGGLVSIDSMFAMKVNFLLEQEWGSKYGNLANGSYRGEHLEPMANGNFLVSGTLGKRIYGMEIDGNGFLVNQKIYYQTPSNLIMLRSEIHQMWRKWYLGYGTYSPSMDTYKMPMLLMDSLGKKVWGGEASSISGTVFVNKELSFIHYWGNSNNIYLSRLRSDSSLVWRLVLGSTGGNVNKSVNSIYFNDNDTGIVVGSYVDYSNNLGQQFWIAKIAGVGTPYDPLHPEDTVITSPKEKLFGPKDAPVLFPNPVKEGFQFKNLTQETKLAIYSNMGVKLLEKHIKPADYVDVCHLAHGAYLYHLQMGERVFTGKFLKR